MTVMARAMADIAGKPTSALGSLVISTILDNGFKFIYAQEKSNPVVCLQLYIKTGSVKETSRQRGYSHFLEHLSFKSTHTFPDNGIARYASSLGGMINAFTDFDCTCYYLLLPSEAVSEGLHILSQLAMHINLKEADVLLEKDVIIEEIKQYENDPEPDFIEYIQKTYFRKSPLKYPVLGYPDTIAAATCRDLRAFYKHHYKPDNAFLVVCGDIQIPNLLDKVHYYFSGWKSTSGSPTSLPSLEPEITKFRKLSRINSQREDMLAFVLPELSELHPDSDAMLVAMRYFAIGKSSRLFKRMVEEEQLCSSVKVSSLCGMLSGASVILVCPLHQRLVPRILEIFNSEYFSLMNRAIPMQDFQMVKSDIINSWMFSFDGMENLANLIAAEEFIGNLDRINSYGDVIKCLSIEDISTAIAKWWQPNGLSIYFEGTRIPSGFISFRLSASPNNIHISFEPNTLPEITAENSLHPPELASAFTRLDDCHYQLKLSSGLEILYKYIPQKSVSGFALSTHVSQLCESTAQRGLNFFATALSLYRSKHYSQSELMHYSRAYGFNIRLIHHLDSTTYRGKCQAGNLDKALALLAELVLHPSFDRQHLRLLKSSALDAINRENAYPVSYAYQKWFQLLVGTGSNLFRSTGDAKDIHSVRLDNLESWYSNLSMQRDFHLGVVSSITPEQLLDLCEEYFAFSHESTEPFIHCPDYKPTDEHYLRQYRRSEQAVIHLGSWATPAANQDDNAAFYVLAQIIGGEISSRFFDIIREKYGYAYQIGFDFNSIKQLGFWNAFALCDKKDYKHCVRLMQDIIADVVDNGVTEEEVYSAKKYLIGMSRFDNESVSYTASSMATLAALGYPYQFYLSREMRLQAITLEQVNHLAKIWLKQENQYLHILV